MNMRISESTYSTEETSKIQPLSKETATPTRKGQTPKPWYTGTDKGGEDKSRRPHTN
jgi:hypothetical protein